jgi:effector-binding domain-containing protein
MERKILAISFGLVFLGWQLTALADPNTMSPSAGGNDVRIQSLESYTYAYISTQTTLNTLQNAIGQLLPQIDAAVDAGKLRPRGPYVFTYHGATGERDKTFTLDIGVIVKDGTTAPDGIQIIKVGPLHCATLICAGGISQLPQAYGKLYGEIGRRGLQATDVSREVYFYWEDENSQNNLIQIQAELAPAAGAAPAPTD